MAAVIGAMLVARLVVGALAPLSEDEAYYRLWSLKPAFGYFDHPPMIAWQIWLGRRLAGDTPLGVRLVPILGATLASLATFDLARAAGLGERIGARAAIWLNATLLIGLGGELAVPDQPNTLFWTLALACAFRGARGRPAWWLGAGAAAGLACLSKYSALFLAPGVVLWLASAPDGRKALSTPWPWLAAVIAAAVFAPNIAWNAEHGWMTFAKQFGRVRASGLDLGFLGKLALDQLILLNPLIAVFLGLGVARRAAWPLILISAPFAAYLVIHSLHDEVQGQWPAPLYPSLMIIAASAAEQAQGWVARLRTAAPWLGLGACAAAMVFALAPLGPPPFRDPAHDYRDWPRFAAAVERARLAAGAAWIGTPTYGLAAQFAAAPQVHAPAAQIYQRERYTFETPGERADFTQPGLVIGATRDLGPYAAGRCFDDVEMLPNLRRGEGRSAVVYRVYRVAGPRSDVERQGCYRPPEPNR
jgi:4-amino-4-deoxy-L-arabinose transferase-like glycosyltransferase